MKSLFIEQTDNSPLVTFDCTNKKYLIQGICNIEESATFFEPVCKWIENFSITSTKQANFEFNIKYFNISGSKAIQNILFKIKDLSKNGSQIIITWYHSDDQMLEAGQDFAFLLNTTFQFEKSPNHMPADEFILETISKSNF